MNNYLLLTAAVALSAIQPALASDKASGYKIHFYTGAGNNSYCDGMAFHDTKGKRAKGKHLNEDCGGTNGSVAGKQSKSMYSLNENFSSYSLTFEIAKPIKDGGNWDILYCPNGSSCSELNSGIYKLGFSAPNAVRGSTLVKLKEVIAQRTQSGK